MFLQEKPQHPTSDPFRCWLMQQKSGYCRSVRSVLMLGNRTILYGERKGNLGSMCIRKKNSISTLIYSRDLNLAARTSIGRQMCDAIRYYTSTALELRTRFTSP